MAQFYTAEEIGGLTAFLCSDDARTITGAPFSIDGGWVAGNPVGLSVFAGDEPRLRPSSQTTEGVPWPPSRPQAGR